MSRSWATFNEDKRSSGPLGYGSNQTAAYLAQFGMFFWGFVQFLKRKKLKLLCYGLVAATIFAILYTFSRGAYLALLVTVFILGVLKDRKLLLVGAVFLLTWEAVVPTAVRERVTMTQNSSGQLEASANERVKLWQAAADSILSDPILGSGFATYQYTNHVDNLKDTHNWYVKVMVETGIIGLIIVLFMLQQMLAVGYRLFKRAEDPLFRGLGLGLFLAIWACIVANCFGDRWTYLEITSPLWVLIGTAICASQMPESNSTTELPANESMTVTNPYLVYR
jgi:O-antigen ligase